MSKALRIPARPTDHPQPWPEELDGLMPDFVNMTTERYGWEYGVKDIAKKFPKALNSYQWRIQELDLIAGKVTLTIEEDYTPFIMSGNELIFTLDLVNRTYDIGLGDHDFFDLDEYLETEEDERLVGIIPFKEPGNGTSTPAA